MVAGLGPRDPVRGAHGASRPSGVGRNGLACVRSPTRSRCPRASPASRPLWHSRGSRHRRQPSSGSRSGSARARVLTPGPEQHGEAPRFSDRPPLGGINRRCRHRAQTGGFAAPKRGRRSTQPRKSSQNCKDRCSHLQTALLFQARIQAPTDSRSRPMRLILALIVRGRSWPRPPPPSRPRVWSSSTRARQREAVHRLSARCEGTRRF